jgi:4a-hydroxytetrahydrobiopterin dehydratase
MVCRSKQDIISLNLANLLSINKKNLEYIMKNLNTCLLDKTCTPCQGGIPPLSLEIASSLLLELGNGWIINGSGQLYKEYSFNNFIEAMEFANEIAELSEKEAHHPDLSIAWGKCAIRIWTHKISGLTESDFILAAKIEAI